MSDIASAGLPMDTGAIVALPASEAPEWSCVPLAGTAPLVRVVRGLLAAVPEPRVVVVVARPHDVRVRELLAVDGCGDVVVTNVDPSASRGKAIEVGLDYLVQQHFSLSRVLVHDASRPLAPPELAERVLAGLMAGHSIVVPVMPVTDSVKAVDAHSRIVATIDRTTLLSVQSPRGFAVETLVELVGRGATDELAAALDSGMAIEPVAGHADAARFTLAADATLLEAIIATRR
jgi:2-C-methyl-D-erythritol 4-phosphate cytidylyltransferase